MHNLFSLVENELWVGRDTEIRSKDTIENEERTLPGIRVMVV